MPATTQDSNIVSPPSTQHERQFRASDHDNDAKFHLLLAASGSVATIKIASIVASLAAQQQQQQGQQAGLSIRLVLTQAAANFVQGQADEQPALSTIAAYPNVDGVYLDHDEWAVPWRRGAPVLHIELRRWADLLLVAPLSANTLAKLAGGLCDNLLTCVVRAWQVEPVENAAHQRRILLAPAMNTAMWRHPVTARHLDALRAWPWMRVLAPVQKELACGDTGDGAMCAWQDLVAAVQAEMSDRDVLRHGAS